MLPTAVSPSACSASVFSTTEVPRPSGHVIDDALCQAVMDRMAQGHRADASDVALFAGAFEMLASGRDDALALALKGQPAASGRYEPPPSIAEILKPIEDRGLCFELSVCDRQEFLESSSFTPWSRGLDALKSVRRVPTAEPGPGKGKLTWGRKQQIHRWVVEDLTRRCRALPANGCALMVGSNGWAVVFKDSANRMCTLARKGVGSEASNVPVLSRDEGAPAFVTQPASDALFRVIGLPGSPKWAMAVARTDAAGEGQA